MAFSGKLISRFGLPSLRWQILGIIFLVLLGSLLFYAWIADNLFLTMIDRQLSGQLELAGWLLEYDVPWQRMAGYQPGDQATSVFQKDLEKLRRWAEQQGLSRVTLTDAEGLVRLDTAGLEPGSVSGLTIPGLDPARPSQAMQSMLFHDRQGWQKYADIHLANGQHVRLSAGKEMLAVIDRLRSRRLFALGLGLALAGLLSWGLTFLLSRRLRQLKQGFRELQSGVRGSRVRLSGDDEIAYLANAFNDMAAELEARADRETREQERRLQELKILSAGVAHEIRNPLAAIGGLSDLLARDPAVASSPDSLDLSRRIRREIDRLDRIVTDVLAYARQPSLNPAWESAPGLLQEAATLDPGCRLETPAGPLPAVRVDRADFLTVLRNLAANARDAAGPSGTVRLGVRFKPGRALFYVADNGPGIADANPDLLFQPFFSKKPKGTGLGLAIARNIMEAHGGQLRLARSAQGAVFVAYLPLKPEPRMDG